MKELDNYRTCNPVISSEGILNGYVSVIHPLEGSAEIQHQF